MHRSSRRQFLRTAGLAAGALGVGFAGPASALGALDSAGTDRAALLAGEPLRMARVWLTRETAHLADGLDDTHRSFGDGSYEFLLWPGDLGRLVQTGLRFEITVDDVVARDRARTESSAVRTVGLQPGETETGEYRRLDDYNADMAALAADNPGLVKLIELPYKSLEERTVYGLEICTDVDRNDGRPVFYNDGVHHAREWPAGEVPIMWAHDLVESYRADEAGEADAAQKRIANLVRKVRNVIVPIVNVDGFHFSREFPVEAGTHQVGVSIPVLGGNSATAAGNGFGQYWRKNRRQLTDGGIAREQNAPDGLTAYGVDPNRNYSYQWGGSGSSNSETSGTYRGEAPFSEPESRNVQWIHQTYQCLTEITHHTSGDLVLWAWGDTAADAPDDVLLARLGIASTFYNGYQPTKSIDLYVTTGTCSDYTYGTWASISYTFEHAGDSFHPGYGTTVPAMYAKNREALTLLAEVVCLEPIDRGLLRDEVAANGGLRDALQGDFSRVIEGRQYEYSTSQVVDLDARYHCVLSGRMVDSDGNPVAGTVQMEKDFQNFLWFLGGGQNPIDTSHWPEAGLWSIDVEDDGTFRWYVNPSSRPAYFDDPTFNAEEQYQVSFRTGGGPSAGQSKVVASRDVVLRRGQTIDFGDIVVG
ncbi:M14 family zinc carboxypeptidase [Euzebya pacifica]|uniref:M14 family zinc carboxypeptidase n=1 Tax=Euzebya pacifica TaxID=1608957 RepID=UPI0013E0951E|nr:M14 family zinc carboxypeptidase [Euzebya pacifica]